SATPDADSALAEPLDLHTLLGQMTALRHEVNLQTRATRAQQEQNAEALTQLSQALETIRQARAAAQQADEQGREEHWRPLLKALVDTHDALLLAKRESQRVGEAVIS